MRPKKLLYVMPVSWFWIKQRPQFIALELANYYNVSVACLHDYKARKALQSEQSQTRNFKLYGFPTLNIPIKIGFVYFLQFWLKKFYFNYLVWKNEIIIYTVPEQIIYAFSFLLKSKTIIYDCMDDMPAFYDSNPQQKSKIIAHEMQLCKKANSIVVSSDVLRSRLIERHGINKDKFTVINNGIRKLNFVQIETKTFKQLFSDKSYRYIVYFGTISEWFDTALLQQLLDKYNNLKLVIFGPSDSSIPVHNKIVYGGILKHHQIESVMMLADALIMPFKKTDLVLAVNPVKAYEYISSGKPVILTSYGETQKFADYAYLYDDSDDLDALFLKLSNNDLNPKQSKSSCEKFGMQNTWQSRGQAFNAVIQNASDN